MVNMRIGHLRPIGSHQGKQLGYRPRRGTETHHSPSGYIGPRPIKDPTMRQLGVDSQTIFGMPPVEQINLAATLGCSHISFGLQPVPWKLDGYPAWSLRDDIALRRNVQTALREQGIFVALAEGFPIRAGLNMCDRGADLDLFAQFGARWASTVCMDPDLSRALDELGVLAQMTSERGMGLLLEFAPPHSVNTLSSAVAAVKNLNMPHVGLVIDAMHFFRSGSSLAELAAIDPQLISYVQLCDATAHSTDEDYYKEASFERLPPGEGELPLKQLIDILPQVPLGIEVPMRSRCRTPSDLPGVLEHLVRRSRELIEA
jgi:sugar phosphate isomerase/epimerase